MSGPPQRVRQRRGADATLGVCLSRHQRPGELPPAGGDPTESDHCSRRFIDRRKMSHSLGSPTDHVGSVGIELSEIRRDSCEATNLWIPIALESSRIAFGE